MTKKGRQKLKPRKFFPKTPRSEILVGENFFRPPQTRRQVSATA